MTVLELKGQLRPDHALTIRKQNGSWSAIVMRTCRRVTIRDSREDVDLRVEQVFAASALDLEQVMILLIEFAWAL